MAERTKPETVPVDAPMDAAAALAAVKSTPRTSVLEEIKDDRGFVQVFNKDKLCGIPFVIIDWDEEITAYGVVAHVRLVQGGKNALYFRDGSTGVCAQLQKLRDDKGVTRMIDCPKGLRVSRYKFDGNDAQTYYLDTEAR
jgi:hypothetical protein